jgi:transcriptional regulator with XRE-family HTH domain
MTVTQDYPSTSLDLSSALGPLIARRKLNMAEVARRLPVDPAIVSLWCSGRRRVPASRLEPLARVLKVPLQQLVRASGNRWETPPPAPRWKPCPRGCGRHCLDTAAMCLACAHGHPPLVETAAERLASAGMRAETHKAIYELACLLCGRGDGRQGALRQTHTPPVCAPPPCRWCGGFVFVREVTTWSQEFVVFERDSRADVDDDCSADA